MDHYKTLQVSRNAESEVIEKAYKALSLKYHPDTAAADQREKATRRMQRINAAYDVLRDPARRRRYDREHPASDQEHTAWEVFWDRGLVGMFVDWASTRRH